MLAWALPLLLPRDLLASLGFPVPEPILFLRFLEMAYTALVVGYVLGYLKARIGEYPAQAVWVGIVSNGGAAVILALGAVRGAWSQWGALARISMWFSLFAVTLITLGLLAWGPLRKDR